MTNRTAKPIDVEIGQRLRQARIRLDLTQTDLGRAVGLTFQQIQKYERGDNRIALSTLAQFRNVLGIEAADLLPPLRHDGSPIADPLAAQGATITGVHLAKLFGQMRPDQQHSVLEIAKVIVRASTPSPALAA